MVRITCIETLTNPSRILLNFGLLNIEKPTPSNIVKIMLNYLVDSISCTMIILNMRNAVIMKDSVNTYWMACLLIPLGTYSAKKTTLLVNRSTLILLFEQLKSDIFNSRNERLNRHIQSIQEISQLISKYFTLVVATAMVIYGVLPFIMDIKLMIPAPFQTGQFDAVYKILHVLVIGYFGITLIGLDVFYMTLIALGVAEIDILRERLTDIKRDAEESSTGDVSKLRYTKQLLDECVILYDAIHRYVENLSIVLALPLSIQYISGCFAMSNMLLQMRNTNEAQSSVIGTIATYCGTTLGQITAYHWLSNEILYKLKRCVNYLHLSGIALVTLDFPTLVMLSISILIASSLTFQSDQITTSCYFSKWYELSSSSQKSLVVIMERAKRPLTIRLYNYVLLNLDSLGAIFRWSYSIFALLKAQS